MIRTVLADFRAWLAMPRLITPTPWRTGWRTWGVMLGLYLCGLVVIGAVLAAWQRAMHVPAPEAFRGFSGPVLAVAVVLAAPIGEESLFRGWLTGRPRALWLLAMAIIAGLMLIAVQWHWHDTAASLGFVATLIAALVGWAGAASPHRTAALVRARLCGAVRSIGRGVRAGAHGQLPALVVGGGADGHATALGRTGVRLSAHAPRPDRIDPGACLRQCGSIGFGINRQPLEPISRYRARSCTFPGSLPFRGGRRASSCAGGRSGG